MWQRNTSLNSNPAFVRRSLFVTLGIVVVALNVLSQDASRESGPGRPWSQAADRAAITFAKELAPEGTAQYTATLRKALALARGIPFSGEASRSFSSFAPNLGLLDLDERYRRNFTSSLNKTMRIWGGEPVLPDTYPDTVALLGNGGLCTGTVIASNMVLTAAHCFCDGVTERVILGDTINTPASSRAISGAAAMITCNESLRDGDIAVLRVATMLNVRPRALANDALITRAISARAVGYGRSGNPRLKSIDLEYVGKDVSVSVRYN